MNIAHQKPHSLTPLKPDDEEDDVRSPAAVATTDQRAQAAAEWCRFVLVSLFDNAT
jgi:hypothetical protein